MPGSSEIDLIPPVSLSIVAGFAVAALAGFLILRWLVGPPVSIARRWGFLVIRLSVLLILMALLLNPVQVDESPGTVEAPDVFYLLDSSESMALGTDSTRWEDALGVMREADALAGASSHARISRFRFGHRLKAIEAGQLGLTDTSATPKGGGDSGVAYAAELPDPPEPLAPTDSDTQMLSALRQLTSRFGRSPPSAVVLFSDGQARDATAAEEIAAHYKNLAVPVHVVPLGDEAHGGDIAIVGVVAPEKVRKFSQVDVQVFYRSYGYANRRSEVSLYVVDDDGKLGRRLDNKPILLDSGFQSTALSFQSDLETRHLQVVITPQSGEISLENNRFDTQISIDRTKIRVLYVEGNSGRLTTVRAGQQTEVRGPFSDIRNALTADADIECVVLAASLGSSQLRRVANQNYASSTRVFPQTPAELMAYDAIILSNISQSAFTDQQLEWIEKWIGQRGGGLCMTGGPYSFAAGGWNNGVIEQILPVELNADGNDWFPVGEVTVRPQLSAVALHPIWHLVSDEAQNRSILRSLPMFTGLNRIVGAKEPLSNVLATTDIFQSQPGSATQGLPVITTGAYGRGRSMAITTGMTEPWAVRFAQEWGEGDNRYFAKFWRNIVYWLTENSEIGRRRLTANADKRFYRPGESLIVRSTAYEEAANQTTAYRIVGMIEPQAALSELQSDYSPVLWPAEIPRTSGEEGPFIAWGEEFELTKRPDQNGYQIELRLAEALASAAATQAMRLELTAYEEYTQVDSTSIDVQVLHDPFEQQNPLPNHSLMVKLAEESGGQVLQSPKSLATILTELPVKLGAPQVSKVPLWSQGWLLFLLLLLLTIEWVWRRSAGLA